MCSNGQLQALQKGQEGQGRQGGYVTEALDYTELAVGDHVVESLWVRTKGQANKGDFVVGVYYRPPSHDDDTDELSFKEPKVTSRSAALILMGDFNLSDVKWEIIELRLASSGDS